MTTCDTVPRRVTVRALTPMRRASGWCRTAWSLRSHAHACACPSRPRTGAPTTAHRGLTLVELLVVLTILAVVVSLAAPALRQLVPTPTTPTLATRVAAARARALRTGRPVPVSGPSLTTDRRTAGPRFLALPDGSVLAEPDTIVDRLTGRLLARAPRAGTSHEVLETVGAATPTGVPASRRRGPERVDPRGPTLVTAPRPTTHLYGGGA